MNDVYQLNIAYQMDGEFMENVLHYQDTASGVSTNPEAQAGALVSAFQTSVQAAMLGCLPTTLQVLGYRARRVNNTGGPTYVLPTPALFGTAGIAGCVSTRLCALLTLDYYESHTPFNPATHRGPSWRHGSIYLPIPNTWYVDNQFIAGVGGNYNTFINSLTFAITSTFGSGTITAQNGVWSKKYSTFYTSTAIWELQPTAASVKKRILPHL